MKREKHVIDNEARYDRWHSLFRATLGETAADLDPQAIYTHFRPTFHRRQPLQILSAAAPTPVGLSRLEGLPDLPPTLTWPEQNGQALDFLAQINLAHLEKGFHPLLPPQGWLYFFVGDFWNQNVIPHHVLYYDGEVSDLAPTPPPPDLQPPQQLLRETALLSLTAGFTMDPDLLPVFWSRSYDESKETFYETLAPLSEPCQPETTRLGGYAYGFQGDHVDHTARLYLNGFATLVRYGYFHPQPWFRSEAAREAHFRGIDEAIAAAGDGPRWLAEAERYENLPNKEATIAAPVELLLGLESVMNRYWLDMGFLQFFIRQDDLAAARFDNTFCDIIST
ncbi:MAG: DUF1963 domain-containing protein [Anaerolineales bacterium]|nr:DUF1963 domain-containing protein [Anaerolineales bacterium]